MLDIRYLRDHGEEAFKRLSTKDVGITEYFDVEDFQAGDASRRRLLIEVETLKNRRNVASKEFGALKKQGQDISEKQCDLRDLGDRIKSLDQQIREVDEQLEQSILALPNVPHRPPSRSANDP